MSSFTFSTNKKYFSLLFFIFLSFPLFVLAQFPTNIVPKNLLDNDAQHIIESIQKIESNTIKQVRLLEYLVETYNLTAPPKKATQKIEELANYIAEKSPNNTLSFIVFTMLCNNYFTHKNTEKTKIEQLKARCTLLYEKLAQLNDCQATNYLLIVAKCYERESASNFLTCSKLIDKALKEAKQRKCPLVRIETLAHKASLLYIYHYDSYGALIARIEAINVMDSLVMTNKNLFDKKYSSELYMSLANVHYKVGNNDEAIKYWNKAAQLVIKQNTRQEIQITNNIGLAYQKKQLYAIAINYFQEAVILAENQKDSVWIGLATGNVGDAYMLQKEYKKALPYLATDVAYSLKFKELDNACLSIISIAKCHLQLQNNQKALQYLTQATNIIKENETYMRYRDVDYLFTKMKLYKTWLNYHIIITNQPLVADYFYKLNHLRDSVAALQKGEKLSILQKSYDLEYNNSQKRIKQLEDESVSTKNIFIISSCVLLFLLGLFLLRNYQTKSKLVATQNKQKILELIAESTINKQKIGYLETIEEQNRDITASIEYAKIIQQSILPSNKQINEILGNEQFFTVYQPKDIVSGDFYLLKQKADKIIIILADCTGHGVPGAMMSMLANELLHEEISQNVHLKPNALLQNIYVQLKKRLNMKETKRYDGMDIAMIIYDKTTKILDFASVGSVSACYVKDNMVTEFPRNKIYVPMLLLENTEIPDFEKFSILLDKTTKFYMFSDGITDQFDGIYRKKFGRKKFLELLQNLQEMPLNQQKNHIETVMNDWKRDASQTDDISLLAFEIGREV